MSGLPDGSYITDGGMETTLLFQEGIELPGFASFPLVQTEEGRAALRRYFAPYLEIARKRGVGLLVDTPTWRANPDWGARLGYSLDELEQANRDAVAFMDELRSRGNVLVSGCIGPRGDGYAPGSMMGAEEAEHYHGWQASVLAGAGVDLISALTINYVEEAVGIARAVERTGLPSVISFTVETDGRLPSRQRLRDAVEQVDERTGASPAFYMINCAHPSHFADALEEGPWLERIRGLRANASTKSHAELDEAGELDSGDPQALAAAYVALRSRLPNLTVVGGCCGTDDRHIDAISAAWAQSS